MLVYYNVRMVFLCPQKHAQCSESFYRDCFMTELQQRRGRYMSVVDAMNVCHDQAALFLTPSLGSRSFMFQILIACACTVIENRSTDSRSLGPTLRE